MGRHLSGLEWRDIEFREVNRAGGIRPRTDCPTLCKPNLEQLFRSGVIHYWHCSCLCTRSSHSAGAAAVGPYAQDKIAFRISRRLFLLQSLSGPATHFKADDGSS